MGAVLDHFLASGVRFRALDDGLLRASGRLTDELRAAIRQQKATILAELAEHTHYRWWVRFPDGRAFEVCYSPEVSRLQVEANYPEGVAEPLPDEPDGI